MFHKCMYVQKKKREEKLTHLNASISKCSVVSVEGRGEKNSRPGAQEKNDFTGSHLLVLKLRFL